MGSPEESQVGSLEGRDQRRPIQILVPPLARRFGQERAGVARSPVELLATADRMLGTQRVRRTEAHLVQRPANVPTELVGFTEGTEAAQRSFAVRGRRVNQHARHRIAIAGLRE